MNLLGRPGGYCRRPLLDLNAEETSKVRDILTSLSLLEMAEAS
jgi:dihydrodipicolinate synthase/N-acetylneuraminate lyase